MLEKNKPVQLKLAKFATDTRTTVLDLNVYFMLVLLAKVRFFFNISAFFIGFLQN